MDDVVNRFAKELADAIAAAVAENPQVEACRARAREAGYDMRVTLEAVVGFASRTQPQSAALAKVVAPPRPARDVGGFRIGQNVMHPKFGPGVIIDAEGHGNDARVQVNFGNLGVKWLAVAVAKLQAA